MAALHMLNLAKHYCVNDLPGSTIPASRLRDILERIQERRPLTTNGLHYLQQIGLSALGQLARGEVSYKSFRPIAEAEQAKRERIAEMRQQAEHAAMLAEAAEQAARAARYQAQRNAARLAMESDPRHIAKMKNRSLRKRYGIDVFIEKNHFGRLMGIIQQLDDGNRVSENDALWLTTEGKDYYSVTLQSAFHEREAEYFANEYRRTSDPWNAINASAEYRKCKQASKANDLLASIPSARLTTPKLKSAVATTHGGAMRDLRRLDDALRHGNQAHALAPNDYYPCTLLGAVNFELGHYAIGQDWYTKAVERGAPEHSVDKDLRGILVRATPARRKEIQSFLLSKDPIRYKWVNDLSNKKPKSTGTQTRQHR